MRERARESLVHSSPISNLSAIANHRAHGLCHLFNGSPTHILPIEAMARRFHPDLFADVDPDAKLRDLNSRFLVLPLKGRYRISQQ